GRCECGGQILPGRAGPGGSSRARWPRGASRGGWLSSRWLFLEEEVLGCWGVADEIIAISEFDHIHELVFIQFAVKPLHGELISIFLRDFKKVHQQFARTLLIFFSGSQRFCHGNSKVCSHFGILTG